MDVYIQFINSQNLDRELKIHVYSSMSDIIIGLGTAALPYSSKILNCLSLGCSAAINLSNS